MTISKNSNLVFGACKVFLVSLEDVLSVTSGADKFHQSVTLKDEMTWTEIYFTLGTAEIGEKPKDTDSGLLYEQLLKFQLPGEDDALLSSLDQFAERPLLVKVQFSNVLSKLFGNTSNGVKLSPTYQVNSKSSGYQLEFSCLATRKSCWIT